MPHFRCFHGQCILLVCPLSYVSEHHNFLRAARSRYRIGSRNDYGCRCAQSFAGISTEQNLAPIPTLWRRNPSPIFCRHIRGVLPRPYADPFRGINPPIFSGGHQSLYSCDGMTTPHHSRLVPERHRCLPTFIRRSSLHSNRALFRGLPIHPHLYAAKVTRHYRKHSPCAHWVSPTELWISHQNCGQLRT